MLEKRCAECGTPFTYVSEKKLYCSPPCRTRVQCKRAASRPKLFVEHKVCTKCKLDKDRSEYGLSARAKDGLQLRCKACLGGRNWPTKSREYRHKQKLKSSYGITVEQYDRMFEQQEGKCAICRQPETKGWWLAVDHCHHTSTVRGLLCVRCNRGMGFLSDDASLLRAAAEYLDSRKGANAPQYIRSSI